MNPTSQQLRRSSSAHAIVARVAAVLGAVLLVSFLLLSGSRAAFNASTSNTGNSVSTASISLADNDSGTAMFSNVTGLVPGTNVDRCIDVAYAGSVDPLAVKLYAANPPGGSLAPYLNLQIDVGNDTPDAFGSCTSFVSTATLYTGTVAAFDSTYASYGSGLTTWDPSGAETKTFRVRLAVQNDNAAQGLTSTFEFTWETTSP